jgi:hypothetical protein
MHPSKEKFTGSDQENVGVRGLDPLADQYIRKAVVQLLTHLL